MGARFKQVSFSIIKSESKEGMKNLYKATCAGLYYKFKIVNLLFALLNLRL
jgi:hypothetical protein